MWEAEFTRQTSARKQGTRRGNRKRMRREERPSSPDERRAQTASWRASGVSRAEKNRQRAARATRRGRRKNQGRAAAGQRNQGKDTVATRTWTVVSKAAHGRRGESENHPCDGKHAAGVGPRCWLRDGGRSHGPRLKTAGAQKKWWPRHGPPRCRRRRTRADTERSKGGRGQKGKARQRR